MATVTEVEYKYEVPVDFTMPELAGVPGVTAVGDPAEQALDATYYDTPELRLAGHRVTLRRRAGGHDAGWHLKRPAAAGARTETQEPITAEQANQSEQAHQSEQANQAEQATVPAGIAAQVW